MTIVSQSISRIVTPIIFPAGPIIANRVLIVEDDAMICMVLAAMVVEIGHDVCGTVGTEEGAIEQAATLKPDLMIVDDGLRGGSGVAAMIEILKTENIPHLFMSGNIAKVRAQRPFAIMLEKPFKEPALILAIQQAMCGHAAL